MLPYFRFHHIGVAVFDIEATAGYYVGAGYSRTETVTDSLQGVRLCFLTREGMPTIELLAPLGTESPVSGTLEKNGVAPYHFCYEVDDLDRALADMKKLKFVLLAQPVAACAMGGRRVCFLYNSQVGLVELVEAL